MPQLVEAVVPARLGPRFRWLLASSWIANVSDGIALAAGPLLVASQTDEPFLVALATIAQQAPWLLFGLYAGVVADAIDRRRLIVVANLARIVLLVVLAATIAGGAVDVGVVLVSLFLLGVAETFHDTTGSTLLPMLVPRSHLGIANARLHFGNLTINRLAAPPVGAFLFATGMALPFVTQAVCLAMATLLIARIGHTPPAQVARAGTVRNEISEGLRWVWRHRVIRTLVLTILAFNITFGAVYGVMVLYVQERLGLGARGFGLFMGASALGGVLGTLIYGRLESRLRASGIMRVGLLIETCTHLGLALATSPVVAFPIMFVFGIHEAAWGTTVSTVRQRAVPNELQGRVGAIYMVSVFGSLVVGSAIGGLIAGVWGITAPFWFGFVGSAVILLKMWGTFAHLAETDRLDG